MKILRQERIGNKVSLDVEEDYSELAVLIDKAYNDVAADVEVPGFRKGKAPRAIIEQKIGKQAIVDRAIQDLIFKIYPEIVRTAKIEPVDNPQVEVQRIEEGKSITLKISVDVYPNIKLGKYKGIKVAKKESESEQKNAVVEEVLKEVEVDIGEGMIRRETDLMVDELRVSLEAEGLALEDYLKGIKKTIQSLREEFKSGAIARVRARLALREIAKAEKIEISEKDLNLELLALSKEAGQDVPAFKDAIGEIGIENIKDYLSRRKALDFLVLKAKISKK